MNVALGGNLSMVDNPTTFTSSNSSLPYYMDGHRPDGDENELLDMLNSGQRDLNLGLLGRLPMWVEHHQQQYSAPQTASTNDQTRFQISNPNTRLQHALNGKCTTHINSMAQCTESSSRTRECARHTAAVFPPPDSWEPDDAKYSSIAHIPRHCAGNIGKSGIIPKISPFCRSG